MNIQHKIASLITSDPDVIRESHKPLKSKHVDIMGHKVTMELYGTPGGGRSHWEQVLYIDGKPLERVDNMTLKKVAKGLKATGFDPSDVFEAAQSYFGLEPY